MKQVFVLCGLPFAGKTTTAKSLYKDGALLIERDAFLEQINREPETRARLKREAIGITDPISKLSKTVGENAFNDVLTMEYCRRVSEEILHTDALTIIVDGTHLQPLSRSFISQLKNVESTAIVINTPLEICLERLKNSSLSGIRATLTPEMISHMAEAYIAPSLNEGFNKIIEKPR